MKTRKLRVGIVGVGNCASSLVQGLSYYRDAHDNEPPPGLMNVAVGGYHVRDIEISAAFVGKAERIVRRSKNCIGRRCFLRGNNGGMLPFCLIGLSRAGERHAAGVVPKSGHDL